MAGKSGHRGWGHIRRLPSGRFQVSYVGPDMRRHTAPMTYSVKLVAEGWLAEERRLIESDSWSPPTTRDAERKAKAVTVADYSATWLEHRHIKQRTRVHYRALLNQHINPALGSVPLGHLTAPAVRSWYATTLIDKPTYRTHAYGLLHAICATAVKDGLLLTNPCMIDRAMSTHRKREPVILAVPELAKLADAIEPERFKALVLLSAWCGLRWGEVTELRRGDIGPAGEVVSVSRGVVHRDGCRIDTPKSGRVRTVVVPPHIRAALKHHLDTHTSTAADALLFPPSRGGCHLNDKTFRHHFAPALAKIGRDGMRIHDLRHFAGTQTARVANLVETMGRLGHATAKASLLYQQQVSGRDVEIAEALSRLAACVVAPDRDI